VESVLKEKKKATVGKDSWKMGVLSLERKSEGIMDDH